MDSNNKTQITPRSKLMERSRIFSDALSEAARRARFSMKSRASFTGGGFRARRGATLMRLAIMFSFALMVIIPTTVGAIYYAFIASDQYIAEANFTVSSAVAPKEDDVGALSGIPMVGIIQDTQIVTDYIQSRAAVEKLNDLIDLRKLYSKPEIDVWARFDASNPIEKLVKYWRHMIRVSIKMPSGIVEFEVRAFSADDAKVIGDAVLQISEELINDLNRRMNNDAVKNATQQLERASVRLVKARVAFEKARNEGGVLDVNKAADSLNGLITETKGSLLQFQQEYATQRQSVEASAPQMRALKARIDATKTQIDELTRKLTGAVDRSSSGAPLAITMTKFSELDLEQQIAQRLYSAAASSLEMMRLIAENKMMYIDAFVRPAAPEKAQYPRRVLFPVMIFGIGFFSWAILCGLATLIRNHMA